MSCSNQPYYLWALPWQAFNGDGWFNPRALLIGFSSRWLVTQTHTPPLTLSPPGTTDPPTACSLKGGLPNSAPLQPRQPPQPPNTLPLSLSLTHTPPPAPTPQSWMCVFVLQLGSTGVSLLAFPFVWESVESRCMQQRMQKPMQITHGHLTKLWWRQWHHEPLIFSNPFDLFWQQKSKEFNVLKKL